MYDTLVYTNMSEIVTAIIVGGVLFMLLYYLFGKRRSFQYRKLINDLYIASKMKSLANEENLNLAEEYESFKAWLKKERLLTKEYDLDETLEEELKEKLAEKKKQ